MVERLADDLGRVCGSLTFVAFSAVLFTGLGAYVGLNFVPEAVACRNRLCYELRHEVLQSRLRTLFDGRLRETGPDR